jgi:hypothetical protein
MTGAAQPPRDRVEMIFSVGRFTCTMTFTLPAGPLRSSWQPDIPATLTKAEIAQYRAARDRLVKEVAAITGRRIGILEL